jgi:hypothetical protein
MPAPPKPGIAEHEESSLRIQKGAGLLGGWVLYMKTECRQGKAKPQKQWTARGFSFLVVGGIGFFVFS